MTAEQKQVWPWLLRGAGPKDRLDLAGKFVEVGPYTIQGHIVYGAPEWARTEEILRLLAEIPGVGIHITHSGKRSGYGHGTETVTIFNLCDGSIILECSHVDHCDGPGSSCSYPHGPWYRYGSYLGPAPPDPDIALAIKALQTLAEKFRW